MGRYLGPKVKLSRRVGVPIADSPKHTAKELTLPGMHGYRGRRNTEYGVRLIEKQKLRFHYGMLEKQFRKFLDIAKRSIATRRNTMTQILESRLDNVLRRLGVAKTIWAAPASRDAADRSSEPSATDIPSFRVEPGMTI